MPSKINFAKELNEQQLAVVTSEPGPALVLAGAGSGKTRTLIYRLAWLIDNGFKKNRILLLTFTNKAAKQMVERSEQLLGSADDKSKFWGGTFHHTANRLLRKYGKLAGLKNNFTILDSEDSRSLIKNALKEISAVNSGLRKPGPPVIADCISYSNNAGLSIEEAVEMKYPEFSKDVGLIEQVAKLYKDKKKVGNCLDFDDLLLYLLAILKQEPYRKVIAKNWDYILVDEYQDTNLIQDEIVRLLAKDHHNILVVGDDAQSIYSFRAANIKNILEFPKQFPQTEIFRLEQNYRSTPEILAIANQVISQNKNQFQKNLFTKEDSFIKPELTSYQDATEEATAIAERILALEDEGVALANIAVLFRAAHQSQELELQLNKRRIPYEMRGGLKFFERAHIKDLLSFLKVVANHSDEAAWLRILQLQEGVGEAGARKIISLIQTSRNLEETLDKDLKLGSKLGVGWNGLVKTLNKALLDKDQAVGFMIRTIAKDYSSFLAAAYANYRDRLDDIEQLALYAEKHESLDAFLAETSLQENFSIRGAEEQRTEPGVILSTVHQAKGLEWHAVFVLNVSDKSFPHPRALKEENGLEEERRLFYVAITRAKKRLYFSYPISGSSYSLSINQPSEFLRQIETRLLAGDSLGLRHDIMSDASGDGEFSYLPDVGEW